MLLELLSSPRQVATHLSLARLGKLVHAWDYRLCIDVVVNVGPAVDWLFPRVYFDIDIVDDFTQQAIPGQSVSGPTVTGWPQNSTYTHTFGPLAWPVVTPLAARLTVYEETGTVNSWNVTPRVCP